MTGQLPSGWEEEEAGRVAAREHKPETDCPYPADSFASYDWLIGYYNEKGLN